MRGGGAVPRAKPGPESASSPRAASRSSAVIASPRNVEPALLQRHAGVCQRAGVIRARGATRSRAAARSSGRPTGMRPVSTSSSSRNAALMSSPSERRGTPRGRRRGRRTRGTPSPRACRRSREDAERRSPPAMISPATCTPCARATSQCSIRDAPPVQVALVRGDVADRVHAGAAARRPDSTAMPPSASSSPACAARPVLGPTPTPTTTWSTTSVWPSASLARRPSLRMRPNPRVVPVRT